nr:transporter substrate-binding protein [Desulfosarcina cetonica]
MKSGRRAIYGLIAGIIGFLMAGTAVAADTIKVGILHSLSGTMAISETTLKDTMLMLIDEQNKKGGLLGKKLEAWWSIRPPTGRCLPKKPAN